MNIIINHKRFEVPADTTILRAVELSGKPLHGIAVALNNKVIKATELDKVILKENDSLTVIKAFYGG